MINSDKKVTIDFVWRYEDPDGKVVMPNKPFYLKHHHTTEYGPTISISQNEEEYYAFPASMFVETVDFLRSEGIIKGEAVVVKEVSEIKLKPKLSAPVIKEIDNKAENTTGETQDVLKVEGEPVESFSSSVVQQESSQEPQVAPGQPQADKDDSDASAEKMALERKSAAEKANKEPGFKVSHKAAAEEVKEG